MALAVLATLALALLGPARAQAATVVAESEPNYTTASAQQVALGTTVSASFRTSGDCDNTFYDCDVYRYVTGADGRVVIDLRFGDTLGTVGSFSVTLQGADGGTLGSASVDVSDYDGSKLRSTFMAAPAGVFYVSIKARVSGFSSGYVLSGQPYTLTTTVEPGVVETETNRATAYADPLPLGTSIKGSTLGGDCDNNFYDCDYYRVSLSQATSLQLDMKFTCNLGLGDLYTVSTLDNTGKQLTSTTLAGPDCLGGTLSALTINAPAGNFYVLVKSRTNTLTRGEPYSLKVSGLLTSGAPSVTGTVALGSALTATAGTWSPTPTAFGYQWYRNSVAVPGATAQKYTITAADAGAVLSVKVSGARTGYITAARTSGGVTIPPGFASVPAPTISGAATVGSTLTASKGVWSPTPTSVTYQWLRNGIAIAGATGTQYKVTSADIASTITVRVTGAKAGYLTSSKTSVGKPALGVFTTVPTPTVSGTVMVGQKVTAFVGTWAPKPDSYGYQWYRDGVAIAGATFSQYKITLADAGHQVSVAVTGKKTGYTTPSKGSARVSVPLLPYTTVPTPAISGPATVDSKVTAGVGTWAPTPDSYGYQWYRDGVAIAGATFSQYKITLADAGHQVSVVVTGKKTGYTSTSKGSARVSVPLLTYVTIPTPTVSGVASAGNKLTANVGTWAPKPDSYGYQWYRDGFAISGATFSQYRLTESDSGHQVSVVVTAKRTGYAKSSKGSARTSVA